MYEGEKHMTSHPRALNVFAALEIKVGETAHDVIKDFILTSAQQGNLFEVLDFLGVLTLGKSKYARFRTDTPRVHGILSDRKVVAFKDGEYVLLGDLKKALGRVPGTALLMPHDPSLHREYRGPKLPHWERQFL